MKLVITTEDYYGYMFNLLYNDSILHHKLKLDNNHLDFVRSFRNQVKLNNFTFKIKNGIFE